MNGWMPEDPPGRWGVPPGRPVPQPPPTGADSGVALMRQHPDTDLILANNDDMILGAYSATQSLKLATGPGSALHLAGVDGVPEALKLIAEGKMDATMFQDPVAEANTALSACVATAKGEAVSDNVLSFKQVSKADAPAALDSVKSVYK